MSECRAEYERKGGRQPGDRIVRCHLDAGHYPQSCHEEEGTGVRWWDIPPSLQLRQRSPAEQVDYWAGKSLEWVTERNRILDLFQSEHQRANAATARAGRAEAAEADLRATVERVRELAERAEGLGEIVHPSDLLAALDSTTPPPSPEGEGAAPEPRNGWVRDRLGRQWRWSPAGEFWCLTDENLRHFHRTWRELVAEFGPLTGAALDGGQPDTPHPNAEDCSRCDPDQMSYPFICPGHSAAPAPTRSGEEER